MVLQALLPLIRRAACQHGLSAASAAAPASVSLLGWLRGAKKLASQVRAGDIVLKDGTAYRVTKFMHNHGTARAHGFIVLDMVDLRTKARTSQKSRTDESVELADVSSQKFQVLYTEGTTVHLLQLDTLEQLQVDYDVFGDGKRWLKPDLEVDIQSMGEEVVAGSVPYKVEVKVLEAPPVVMKDDGTSTRHVVVEGGVSIMVPSHVQKGDVIVIRAHDASYVSKVDSR